MALNYTNPNFTVLGLSHLSAGIFGMIVNVALQVTVSLATQPPPRYIQDMVDQLRVPVGEMVIPGVTAPEPGTVRTTASSH
jgi:cation/acetate symporter